MIYKWFKIFNLGDFTDLGLVSQSLSLQLEGIGLKDFLITQGNYISVTYEGVILPININDKNPFEFEGFAIFLDDTGQDVYFGILQGDT